MVDMSSSQTKQTGYSTEGYGKIHARNILVWGHAEQGNSGAEWCVEHDHWVQKAEVLLGWACCKVHRSMQLSSGICETRNNLSVNIHNEIAKGFRPTWRRRLRPRMK